MTFLLLLRLDVYTDDPRSSTHQHFDRKKLAYHDVRKSRLHGSQHRLAHELAASPFCVSEIAAYDGQKITTVYDK